jgi:hypothetical protein
MAGGYDVSGYHGFGIGPDDVWICKIDSNKNVVLSNCFGGSDIEDAYSIFRTADNSFIISADCRSTDGDVTCLPLSAQAWILKVDSLGLLRWQYCLGGVGTDHGQYAIEDHKNRILTLNSTIGNSNCTGLGSFDINFTILDSSGNDIFHKCLGGSSSDDPGKILLHDDGTISIIGTTSSNDLDVSGNNGGRDIWIVNLDSNYNVISQKCIGGSSNDNYSNIIQCRNGNYVIVGYTASTDINGIPINNHGIWDALVIETDSLWNVLWAQSYGGSQFDYATSVIESSTGSLYVSGYTNSVDGDVSSSHGDYDSWVFKLDPLNTSIGNTDFIWTSVFASVDLNNSMFNITLTSADSKALQLQLFNSIGQQIAEKSVLPVIGHNEFQIKANNVSSGIYYCLLHNEVGNKVVKCGIKK